MTPENIIEICVAIDIAILGIAYPIIVDKISNIGEKFSSQYIQVLFNTEFPQKIITVRINKKEYRISIFKFTLISFLFLILKLQPPFGWENWFINNSAQYLVLFLSTTLTIFFFIWLDKVVLYNGNSKSLLKHLINRFDLIKDETENKEYYLKAINELTFYALEHQDEHLQKTLLEFYYKIFKSIRKNHNKNEPLIYPIDLYFLVNKLIIESVSIENKKLKAIEHRAVSGKWLLGEDIEDIQISEETYSWLWRNIYSICDSPRLIKIFWANSNQYFNYRLKEIYPNYDFIQRIVINQELINKRTEERNQFLEFHYALGGLLLYRKQYDVLKYIFEYTQSQPPAYELLPETMTQIFYWFENFRNEFKNSRAPIDLKYYFPELDNLGNSRQVNYWICCYISILFIRQYSLNQYYTFQNFTALPKLPDDILELSNWLDSVSFFEKCLNDTLINKKLISNLDFEKIIEDKEWYFKKFINDLKEEISKKISAKKLGAQLSEEKIKYFYKESNDIITKAFEEYNSIFIPKDEQFKKSELKLSVNGAIILMSKSAFTDGDIPNLNYDTVFAESIVKHNVQRLIPNSFAISSTKRYLLNKDNILLSLTKLIDNKKDFIIIGVNIGYQLKQILDASIFNNQVHYIPSTDYHSQDILYVLRKRHLPAIEHCEISEDEIQELQLIPINKELKIYASVIDINNEENKAIKEKWNLDNEPNNLDLKVQLAISFLSIIYWQENREIIQIRIVSEYKEQGIQNDLNDIEPLRND